MPDISNPNLCGADADVNKLLNKFDEIKAEVEAGLDKAASELSAALDTGLTELTNDLRKLVPELPELPSLNLQSEIKTLQGLIPGTPEFIALAAKLEKEFGEALTKAGQDLDTIIKAAVPAISTGLEELSGAVDNLLGGVEAGSPDVCKLVANLEKLEGAKDSDGNDIPPIEKAPAVLQAKAVGLAEDASKIVENPNVKAAVEKIEAKVKKFGVSSLFPTKDTAGFKLFIPTTVIATAEVDETGESVQQVATPPSETVAATAPKVKPQANRRIKTGSTTNLVTKGGFTHRKIIFSTLLYAKDAVADHATMKVPHFKPDVANNKPLLYWKLPMPIYRINQVIGFATEEEEEDGETKFTHEAHPLTKYRGADSHPRFSFREIYCPSKKGGEEWEWVAITNAAGTFRGDGSPTDSHWQGHDPSKPNAEDFNPNYVGVALRVNWTGLEPYDPALAMADEEAASGSNPDDVDEPQE